MKNYFFILLFVCFTHPYFAQQSTIDSLQTVLKTQKDDTSKVSTLNDISYELTVTGDYVKAKEYSTTALLLAKVIKDEKGEALTYNGMGMIYDYQDNYPLALKNYFSALKIFESKVNRKQIASCYNNIGGIYSRQNNFTEALTSHFTALKVRQYIGDKQGISDSYNNIASVYYFQADYEKALKYYLYSLNIRREIDDKYGIAESYNNVGATYKNLMFYNPALKYYTSSLRIRKEIGDKYGIASSYGNIGEACVLLQKFDEAKRMLDSALYLAKEVRSKEFIRDDYNIYSMLDSATNNWKAAYEHHKLYIVYKDSLYNEENTKKMAHVQMVYEIEKEQIREKAEDKRLEELAKDAMERSENIQMAGIGVFIIILIAVLLLLSRRKIKAGTMDVLSTFSVLMLFEFLSLVLHPRIETLTNHNFVFTLLCLVTLASIIVPTHHKLQHWLKHKLVNRVVLQTAEGVKVEVNEDAELIKEIEREEKLAEETKHDANSTDSEK